MCTNAVGSFTCSFKSGYARNGTLCTDIDECVDGTHICHSGRECVLMLWACLPAHVHSVYARNGTLCTDFDKCADGTHNCDPGPATYSNNVGSFTSACKSGYTGNGTLCTDTEKCANGTYICHPGRALSTNALARLPAHVNLLVLEMEHCVLTSQVN